MRNTPDTNPNSSDSPAPARGEDDRRSTVDPNSDPAPSSPAPDEDAVREAMKKLDQVSPK